MTFRFRGKKFDGSAYDSGLKRDLKRILQQRPAKRLDSLVGLKDAKKILKEAISPEGQSFSCCKASPVEPKAVLMVGPTGAGKSDLAISVIDKCNTKLFHFTAGHAFFYKSEKSVQLLLEVARFYAPSTIFIDKLEYLDSETTRIVKEILMEMKGITSTQDPTKVVTLIAATNLDRPIDEALIRSFDKIIYIPLLNAAGRLALIKNKLRGLKVAPDVDFEEVANSLEGYNGRGIKSVCRYAAMNQLHERLDGVSFKDLSKIRLKEFDRPISREDFRMAINANPKTSLLIKAGPEECEKWMAKYGSA